MRKDPIERRALLRGTTLLRHLDDSVLCFLEDEVDVVAVSSGDIVIREGELADCLYMVISGRLRVTVEQGPGREQVVGEVGRGESVGEMAILAGGRRFATVSAMRDTQLLRLSRAAFERLLQRAPETAMDLARLLVLRLEHTQRALHLGRRVETPVTIALVPAAKDVPLREMAAALAAALRAYGTTACIDRLAADEALGPGAAEAPEHDGDSRIVAWLNERESLAQFLLYEADSVPSAWNRRCLRQADRVLVVARADGVPSLGDAETEVWGDVARHDIAKELVLLHDPHGGRPLGTRAWLERPRRFSMHHHVRPGSDEDVTRLARMLAGRAVGLVLGGGGARAFAHIGVIRALKEAGIPIDLVGGSSMGAVIAAQCAMGWDDHRMRASMRRAFIESGSLYDFTVPLMSLIGGRRVVRRLGEMFGAVEIEDLSVKYFCVSTNLTRAEQVVHQAGPLVRWLAATLAVPGLAPPLFDEGDLLVDGSVLNAVPTDVVRGFARGPVIAVDVTPRVDVGADPAFPSTPSAWWVLRQRLNPFASRLRTPSLYRILLRASMLSRAQSAAKISDAVDLYIHPPVEGIDLLDWKALDRVVAIGYAAGRAAVAGWPH